MKKTKEQLKDRHEAILRELDSIEQLVARENRVMTAEEGQKYDALIREDNRLDAEMRGLLTADQMMAARELKTMGEQLREVAKEAVKGNQAREISLSVLNSGEKNNIVSAGAQRTTIFEMLPLLEKGLIWNAVGMKVQTGVTGNLLWPYATTNVEVEERSEAAALNDKNIDFANKTAVPYASGITIKVTNEAIDEATFDLAGFVQTQLGLAVQRYLNKKTFSLANWSGLAGPFKGATASQIEVSYKAIKAAKADIAATGVDMSGFAYVCDAKTKALLEATPKAYGQGGFICENGKIDGDPVYVTEYINTLADGTQETGKYRLELGCWNYLAANQHGDVRLTIDPVTLASSNETKFVLHTRWSLTNLAVADAFKVFELIDEEA